MDEEKVILRENSLSCLYCGKFCKEPFECLNCHLGYCKDCVQMTEECLSEECKKEKKKLKAEPNHTIIRMINNFDLSINCDFCKKNFKDYQEYNNHFIDCSHHFFSCKICKYKFTDKKKFVYHLLYQHSNEVLKDLKEKENKK